MIQDKLIEEAVNSYNTIAKRLIESLIKKETDIETINQLYKGLKEHRKTIKRLFKGNPFLEVYKPEIRKVLQDVRDNKDIFKKLPLIDEESISDYYEGIDYIIEINSEYDLENFILRRMEAGALIIDKKAPASIIKLFDKVKECYMFGLYEATIVFCRALIEESLKKIYHDQNPKLPKRTIEKMGLYDLLNKIKFPYNLSNLKSQLDRVRLDANRFIHRAIFGDVSIQTVKINYGKGSCFVKKKDQSKIQESALSAIRASTTIIEELFK